MTTTPFELSEAAVKRMLEGGWTPEQVRALCEAYIGLRKELRDLIKIWIKSGGKARDCGLALEGVIGDPV